MRSSTHATAGAAIPSLSPYVGLGCTLPPHRMFFSMRGKLTGCPSIEMFVTLSQGIGVSCPQLEEKRRRALLYADFPSSTCLGSMAVGQHSVKHSGPTKALGNPPALIRKCLQSHVCMVYSTAVYTAWSRVCAGCSRPGCSTVTLGGRPLLSPIQTRWRCSDAAGAGTVLGLCSDQGTTHVCKAA